MGLPLACALPLSPDRNANIAGLSTDLKLTGQEYNTVVTVFFVLCESLESFRDSSEVWVSALILSPSFFPSSLPLSLPDGLLEVPSNLMLKRLGYVGLWPIAWIFASLTLVVTSSIQRQDLDSKHHVGVGNHHDPDLPRQELHRSSRCSSHARCPRGWTFPGSNL